VTIAQVYYCAELLMVIKSFMHLAPARQKTVLKMMQAEAALILLYSPTLSMVLHNQKTSLC
jgi:hypothetical protein